MSTRPSSVTATKALAFFANALTGWVAAWYSGRWAALAVISIGAFLVWLVPNQDTSAPMRRVTRGEWGRDAGKVDLNGALTLVVLVLLIVFLAKALGAI